MLRGVDYGDRPTFWKALSDCTVNSVAMMYTGSEKFSSQKVRYWCTGRTRHVQGPALVLRSRSKHPVHRGLVPHELRALRGAEIKQNTFWHAEPPTTAPGFPRSPPLSRPKPKAPRRQPAPPFAQYTHAPIANINTSGVWLSLSVPCRYPGEYPRST